MKVIKRSIVALLVAVALFILFGVMHGQATEQRGYKAIGGEVFVFVLPVIGYAIWKNFKDTVDLLDCFGDEDDEDNQ